MKKKRTAIIAASALALTSTIAGLSAILTDVTEPYTADLRMKYSNDFGIDIDGEKAEKNAVITPGENVSFSPYLENTGSYDAYVFMKIETPDASLTPYEIDSDWTKVTDGVYAYTKEGVLEPLPAKSRDTSGEFVLSSTPPLCSGVRLDEGTEMEQGNITIEAIGYAVDAEEADSTRPSEVWALLQSAENS